MLLTLEPLPAHQGDCLLLHWGTTAKPKLAVIDGGPGDIYDTVLRPRLCAIYKKRKAQLEIDLVMVSHVDNDHIVGIKKLFRKLKTEIQDNLPGAERPMRVDRLWHNTFNDVLGDSIDQYYRKLTATYQASVGGLPNPALVKEFTRVGQEKLGIPEDKARDRALDIALVLAAHGEGRDLRDSQKFLRDAGQISQLNAPFMKNGKPTLIMAGSPPPKATIAGLEFTILGPLPEDVEALQSEFDDYIQEKGLTAEALLSAYTDESVPNLSIIVCLVKANGKRILLTGDARGDKILEGLKQGGELDGGQCEVDILKVPHHGSSRNVEPGFFQAIIADTYVFSGNGKYGNPDRETLEWLTDARGKDKRYQIVFTYALKEIDRERKLENERHKRPWKKATHSLESLLHERQEDGFHFEVVESPSAVDLGDEKVTW